MQASFTINQYKAISDEDKSHAHATIMKYPSRELLCATNERTKAAPNERTLSIIYIYHGEHNLSNDDTLIGTL